MNNLENNDELTTFVIYPKGFEKTDSFIKNSSEHLEREEMIKNNKVKINLEEVKRIQTNSELFKDWFSKLGNKESDSFKYYK